MLQLVGRYRIGSTSERIVSSPVRTSLLSAFLLPYIGTSHGPRYTQNTFRADLGSAPRRQHWWLMSTGRRKALKKQAPASQSPKGIERTIPCWVEDTQEVTLLPASLATRLHPVETPVVSSRPYGLNASKMTSVTFPLTSDHLIILVQYNVLRACLVNRDIVCSIFPSQQDGCSSAAPHVLPQCSAPDVVPSSLLPTTVQSTVPHEVWIDMLPHAGWRDNLILAAGTYDEDLLWTDTLGGLFEGFPASESEQRGVIAWSPPWDVSGWEMSEGFWQRWGWTMRGCDDMLMATNKWRGERGEKPLVVKAENL
jgi:hypothetical protein